MVYIALPSMYYLTCNFWVWIGIDLEIYLVHKLLLVDHWDLALEWSKSIVYQSLLTPSITYLEIFLTIIISTLPSAKHNSNGEIGF
jgi:hypothetical protein